MAGVQRMSAGPETRAAQAEHWGKVKPAVPWVGPKVAETKKQVKAVTGRASIDPGVSGRQRHSVMAERELMNKSGQF